MNAYTKQNINVALVLRYGVVVVRGVLESIQISTLLIQEIRVLKVEIQSQ